MSGRWSRRESALRETIRESGALARRGNRFAGTTLALQIKRFSVPSAIPSHASNAFTLPAEKRLDRDSASVTARARSSASRRAAPSTSSSPCATAGSRRPAVINPLPMNGAFGVATPSEGSAYSPLAVSANRRGTTHHHRAGRAFEIASSRPTGTLRLRRCLAAH